MKRHLRTIVVLAIAVLLLAWFLRHARLADVWVEIRDGRPGLLLLAVATTLATYVLRSFRWQYLVRALGPVRFGSAFAATVIGFAVNFLLPGRVGEVVRPYLLAREERLSATSTFATIILERILDLVTVLVLFGVFLLVFDPGHSRVDPSTFRAVRMGGLLSGAFGVGMLALFFVLAGYPDALARAALHIEHVLPGRMAHAFSRVVHMFVTGLGAVRQPVRLMTTFLLSFPLWLSIAAGIFLVTRAFHMEVPFTGAFVLMAILIVGVAVPTPGAIGGFHEAYRFAVTSFYSVPNERAIGAAIVLHAISFLPVTLLGIIFMAREGMSLGRVRKLATIAGGDEQEATQ